MRYGDREDLARNYPGMKHYLTTWLAQWFARRRRRLRLHAHVGPRRLGSADRRGRPGRPPTRVQIPTVIPPSVTAYVAYMAKITADSARALGKPARGGPVRRAVQEHQGRLQRQVVGRERRLLPRDPAQIFAQSTQVLALAFELVPAERRRGLQEKLVNDVLVTRAGHQMAGIAGNRWIHPVLTQAAREGVPDAAKAVYTVALQTTYPSFGYWAVARLDVAGRVLGVSRAGPATTTSSARSCSGSTRIWPASSRSSRATSGSRSSR